MDHTLYNMLGRQSVFLALLEFVIWLQMINTPGVKRAFREGSWNFIWV